MMRARKSKAASVHILTDTLGLLVAAVVHTADIQDRDGAPGVLTSIRASFPWLRHLFADGGYAGEKLEAALKGKGEWTLEIIKRSDTAKGFVLLPRRWVVERTFAWFGRNRRLAKDFEASIKRLNRLAPAGLRSAHDTPDRKLMISFRNIMSQMG
jgi:putative transposase